jgi:hypothetical protein
MNTATPSLRPDDEHHADAADDHRACEAVLSGDGVWKNRQNGRMEIELIALSAVFCTHRAGPLLESPVLLRETCAGAAHKGLELVLAVVAASRPELAGPSCNRPWVRSDDVARRHQTYSGPRKDLGQA